MLELTEKQKTIFIEILRLGFACGLETIPECLDNYLAHLDMFTEYSKMADLRNEAIKAFAIFYRGSASCAEEDLEFASLTDEQIVHRFYKWAEEEEE